MPVPMSKPSNTTYSAIITAMAQNQKLFMRVRLDFAFRSVLDFALHQKKEEDSKNHVQTHEAEQGEPPITRGDLRRGSGRRAHQSIHEPWLATHFRGNPSGGSGDVRKGHGQHQQPEHV